MKDMTPITLLWGASLISFAIIATLLRVQIKNEAKARWSAFYDVSSRVASLTDAYDELNRRIMAAEDKVTYLEDRKKNLEEDWISVCPVCQEKKEIPGGDYICAECRAKDPDPIAA